jgi:hypothetical protein
VPLYSVRDIKHLFDILNINFVVSLGGFNLTKKLPKETTKLFLRSCSCTTGSLPVVHPETNEKRVQSYAFRRDVLQDYHA